MTHTLEVEANGTLTLPAELLGEAKPHTRYQVEKHGEQLILRPEMQEGVEDETVQKERDPELVTRVRSIRGKYAPTVIASGSEELHQERQRDKAKSVLLSPVGWAER